MILKIPALYANGILINQSNKNQPSKMAAFFIVQNVIK